MLWGVTARHIWTLFFTRNMRGKGVVCQVVRLLGLGGGWRVGTGENPNVGDQYAQPQNSDTVTTTRTNT